jgi:hypothetical protein
MVALTVVFFSLVVYVSDPGGFVTGFVLGVMKG